MNKIALTIITTGLTIGMIIIFVGSLRNNSENNVGQTGQNVEIIDEVQYITISARGGYSPRTSTAKSGVPTKLIIKTDSTYDCSLALVIRSIGYQKMLSQTGEEIIDIGTPKKNEALQATCSMGMYSFKINFN